MASTCTQLHVHCVFSPKYRAALLAEDRSGRLRSYMSAVVQGHNNKMLAINNMPDHLHLFVGLHTECVGSRSDAGR